MLANQSCSKPLKEAPKSSGSTWFPESNWETWALRGQTSGISETTEPVGFSCSGRWVLSKHSEETGVRHQERNPGQRPRARKKTEPDEKDQMWQSGKNPNSGLVMVPVLTLRLTPANERTASVGSLHSPVPQLLVHNRIMMLPRTAVSWC